MLIFEHRTVEVDKVLIILLKEEERPLGCDGLFSWRWLAFCGFPVGSQTRSGNVGFVATSADERSLIVVKPLVQFQMNKLCEAQRTLLTCERFFAFVQSHVSLQVGS